MIEDRAVVAWVESVAAITRPDAIHWCDGSAAEAAGLTEELVRRGTLRPLDPSARPRSFVAHSDPSDVARVEGSTFVCSVRSEDAGPTNNWREPGEMRDELAPLFDGCMRGRTMFVIPYVMGPPDSPFASFGVEITDSPYVVLSMRTMTRMGDVAAARIRGGAFVRGIHSLGAPLASGEADVPWPCNETKYIVHFPEAAEIWSYGSGYGGNALLGKKCHSLRIASAIARREGWFAEHMLILKLTSPEGVTHYLAGAFPSACGKTNLAMLEPTLEGWKAEMVGDDIAWLRFGEDGRLYAVNPEAGLFGVAPGTGPRTNAAALSTMGSDTIFTNVAVTDGGDVWWEGLTDAPPANLTDWRGEPFAEGSGSPAAHPNARFTVPIERCAKLAPEWSDPAGVPISALLFGGRRADVMPLVLEAPGWEEGVFLASSMASEGTSAAENAVGVLRRDPFAMLPFCGYNIGDYLAHWTAVGRRQDAAKLPRIYMVNWFRRTDEGGFVWPGFGDNVRVLKWIFGRLAGETSGRSTAVGIVPAIEELDLAGLACDHRAIDKVLQVDCAAWVREADEIAEFYQTLGDRLPSRLWDELCRLAVRCREGAAGIGRPQRAVVHEA